MKKIALLVALVASHSLFAVDLEYGPFKKYFELGQVDFYRSAGHLEGRVSDFEVTVVNNYPFAICLIPELVVVKNGRDEYTQFSYVIEGNEQVNLGHYGAKEFGKSWHMKWEYFISQDLTHCEN